MSDLIEKQRMLDWLNQVAENLFLRGTMYGNFAMQEATLDTLLSMKYFILDISPGAHADNIRYKICVKYKLNPVLSFSDQLKGESVPYSKEQVLFSTILKDWWELD